MKTFVMKTDGEDYFLNSTKVISDINSLKSVANETALNAIKILAKKPSSSDELSKTIKITKKASKSTINALVKAGLITARASTPKRGDVYKAVSNSFTYEILDSSVKVRFKEQKINDEGVSAFYRKFIKDGKFEGLICVGSTDPHGEYKAISRDTHYAIYLSMFLGQFCELPKNFPIVLDTDVIAKNLFKNNLILVGGPVTNLITKDINSYLPIKFEKEEGWGLKDKEGLHTRDYEGVVEKIRNPFDKTKEIILLSGIRNIGTFSSILAATRFSKMTFKGYSDEATWSALIRGYDIDGDGEIDSIELAK